MFSAVMRSGWERTLGTNGFVPVPQGSSVAEEFTNKNVTNGSLCLSDLIEQTNKQTLIKIKGG